MIFKFVIKKSFDGRSNRNNATNIFYRQSAVDLSSADVVSQVNSMVIAEKALALDFVNFMSMRVIRDLNDDHSPADGDYRYFELAGVGQRASVGPRSPRELCLNIVRQTAGGRAGAVQQRGVLQESDLVRSNNGTITLAPIAAGNTASAFGAWRSQMSSSPMAGAWVMPQPVRRQNLPPRAVQDFVLGGVSLRQLSTNRISIEQARVALIQREINNIVAKARKLQRQVRAGVALAGTLLFALQEYWDTGRALYLSLSVVLRGLVRLPAFLSAGRPALGA